MSSEANSGAALGGGRRDQSWHIAIVPVRFILANLFWLNRPNVSSEVSDCVYRCQDGVRKGGMWEEPSLDVFWW